MGCSFCRTAEMGFVRNLTQGEILDQIIEATHVIDSTAILRQAQDDRLHKGMPRITNVVLMGMGEPLANYDNVLGAITVMISASAFGLSKRHVTLSTSGLVPEIGRLAKDNPGVKLAISLNATTDKVRDRLMPINKKYPLEKLFAALRKYSAQVKTSRITFEYVMVKDLNDSADDAKRLVRLISHIPSKVNLIPLNAVQDGSCRPPANATIQSFANILRNKNIQVNIRSSRGQDILAACGQLASKS
jgi:23S rRNA (adenine2503-C2)-methyltransferase